MPQSKQRLRILAIHAHPDDIEFQCAGTLALLREKGCAISIATMTAGDCGTAELSPEAIAEIRRGEAERSASLLDAAYTCLEFHDLSICFDNDSRRRVTEQVRRVRPDVVITAPPVDYMSDHEVTSRLVRDACFSASVPNYTTGQEQPAPRVAKIPHLYYVDPIEGIDYYGSYVQPEFIVDITATFSLKRDMLACHETQRRWMREQHGVDEYLEACERWSRERGREINTEFGEGFRQHKGHPYPADNLLWRLITQ
jgi:LmbE family N-acetylglucosaminyl deacetylase